MRKWFWNWVWFMKQIDLVDLSCSVTNSGLLVFEHLFKLNSQKHQSQFMYRSHYCYCCKQWVVLNKHEDDCPEMPQVCLQCYKLVMRKNLEVILDLCLLFLLIQFSSESLGHSGPHKMWQICVFCKNKERSMVLKDTMVCWFPYLCWLYPLWLIFQNFYSQEILIQVPSAIKIWEKFLPTEGLKIYTHFV